MSRARDLSKLGNPNVIKADENSVGFGTQVAGNHANADSSLISAGIITATAYYGDGSNLEGVASAGLGTAVDDTKDSIGQNIYFTNAELSINENTTVNAPDTSNIAYTQYQQVTVESGSELIISDGDSFIPDVLGIGTALQASTAGAGNGLFGTVFADNIENAAGRGGPHFPLGITVAGVSTLSGNVSIGGTLTYEDVTNVDSIGVVTARSGVDITGASAGVNGASNLILKTGGSEKVRITSAGKVGIGDADPDEALHVYAAGGAIKVDSNGDSAVRWATSGTNKYSLYHNNSSNALIFFDNTANAERLRIGSAGQLGLSGANYGTSGQVITSQGSGAAPQWASPAGVWVKLASGSATSGATKVITTSHLTSTHYYYKLLFSVSLVSDNQFGINISSNGGTSYTNSSGSWKTSVSGREGSSHWNIGEQCDFGALLAGNNRRYYAGEIKFFNPTNTSKNPSFNFTGELADTLNQTYYGAINSTTNWTTLGSYNAIRFQTNGTISDLKYSLLGTAV